MREVQQITCTGHESDCLITPVDCVRWASCGKRYHLKQPSMFNCVCVCVCVCACVCMCACVSMCLCRSFQGCVRLTQMYKGECWLKVVLLHTLGSFEVLLFCSSLFRLYLILS